MTAEHKLTEYKFEYQWGGEDTWFTKANRWAKKQKFPLNHLALGFIEWLWEHWVDGRVEMEMTSVDKQTEEILKEWEEDAAKYYEPEIVEEGIFGKDGWSISISSSVVEKKDESNASPT